MYSGCVRATLVAGFVVFVLETTIFFACFVTFACLAFAGVERSNVAPAVGAAIATAAATRIIDFHAFISDLLLACRPPDAIDEAMELGGGKRSRWGAASAR